jgi:hypothetical protein
VAGALPCQNYNEGTKRNQFLKYYFSRIENFSRKGRIIRGTGYFPGINTDYPSKRRL